MRLYLCQLTFHENLFYATREMGRLYETGRYLHNYALAYALGLVQAPYYRPENVPNYASELNPLNERGIYVTPGRGVEIAYELITFKYADNSYHVQMSPGSRNTPSYGRAKEIAVGSLFEFAVVSQEALRLPRWIRMGLWQSKALVTFQETQEIKQTEVLENTASLPLNPLDVRGELALYDLISMPPSSLIDQARVKDRWLQASFGGQQEIRLPAHMSYTFS